MIGAMFTQPSEVRPLKRVVLKHVRHGFGSAETIADEWRGLNFTSAPDFDRALVQYDQFVELIAATGARIDFLPAAPGTGLDSIYVRDASVVTPRGLVLCNMGKPQRGWEPRAQGDAFARLGLPVIGEIRRPGRLEGGDVVWLDSRTIALGRGYRTNADGIAQLRALLGDAIDEIIEVPLPHWRGPGDVFHLMSIISPVDDDLAVVYSPLMPVPFRQTLIDRGIELVEVPEEELDALGANVLALAPRHCVMAAGAPRTRALLERAGAEVHVYAGDEISLKGGGGPTCLTRPIHRV
jgi:N-dimethylarginine dimethylaminohydrolase